MHPNRLCFSIVLMIFSWTTLNYIFYQQEMGVEKSKRGKRLGGDQHGSTITHGPPSNYLVLLTLPLPWSAKKVLVFAMEKPPTERKIWPAMRILRTVGGQKTTDRTFYQQRWWCFHHFPIRRSSMNPFLFPLSPTRATAPLKQVGRRSFGILRSGAMDSMDTDGYYVATVVVCSCM